MYTYIDKTKFQKGYRCQWHLRVLKRMADIFPRTIVLTVILLSRTIFESAIYNLRFTNFNNISKTDLGQKHLTVISLASLIINQVARFLHGKLWLVFTFYWIPVYVLWTFFYQDINLFLIDFLIDLLIDLLYFIIILSWPPLQVGSYEVNSSFVTIVLKNVWCIYANWTLLEHKSNPPIRDGIYNAGFFAFSCLPSNPSLGPPVSSPAHPTITHVITT